MGELVPLFISSVELTLGDDVVDFVSDSLSTGGAEFEVVGSGALVVGIGEGIFVGDVLGVGFALGEGALVVLSGGAVEVLGLFVGVGVLVSLWVGVGLTVLVGTGRGLGAGLGMYGVSFSGTIMSGSG